MSDAVHGARAQAVLDDVRARERIANDLDTSFLVEAGAGSGKTTSLVGRMVALVARGTKVEQIAAVTFTRKAANELRERFEVALETCVRDSERGSEEHARHERALHDLDRAFLGTIHSFCGRLLREHPLELALDPNFSEVTDEDWDLLQERFWQDWIERARARGFDEVKALAAAGIAVTDLYGAFKTLVTYPDVDFPLSDVAAPDVNHCRTALLALMDGARELMPADEPAEGWDNLMKLIRELDYKKRVDDWNDRTAFLGVAEGISASRCGVTQKRWSDTKEGRAAVKAVSDDFVALVQGPLAAALAQWREHRYPIVMRVLQRASRDFEEYRQATGQLGFNDLLMLTAQLLREHDEVRAALGARWQHLLVDEFQDTDPIQAEVCLLLSSNPAQGNNWREVQPRPGSLFVVGDPKQSIYRFRRADIQVYDFVKQRIAECGAVLALTQNFRSVRPIGEFVNEHFGGVLPVAATDVQAPFGPMLTVKEARQSDGVYRYTLRASGSKNEEIFALDSSSVASWIAGRITSGERSAGDFLILTHRKDAIEHHARALAERNVAVMTTGAPLPQERELSELVVVLRTIADPDNSVLVAAALEGLFCGLSPADLWRARNARVKFSIAHPPSDPVSPVGRALAQLHAWWILSQRHPVDVLIDQMLDDTGLLAHAASQSLGDARAGALLHLVEVLRAASLLGASAVTDAIERIELLLRAEAPDAPLRPGRADAVRVMNLHKAKGLEGDVVILADPRERTIFTPFVHVTRSESARPTGGLVLKWKDGFAERTIAQPPGWAAMAAEAKRFDDAEWERLLYVATTRAKSELVIARCEKQLKKDPALVKSPWISLETTLGKQATELAITVTPSTTRRVAERSLESMREAIVTAKGAVTRAQQESVRFVSVTEDVREMRSVEPDDTRPVAHGRGVAWGRAVHRGIEALGRGRRGDNLARFLRAVALDQGLSAGDSEELEQLVAAVSASDEWKALIARGTALFELPVMRSVHENGVEVVTHGIIDAATLSSHGWHVVDWKTDRVDAATWHRRLPKYEGQAAMYAEMLQALSATPATSAIRRLGVAAEEK